MREYTQSIYKLDTKGKLRIWYAEVVGECWRVVTGIDGGKLVESGWTHCTTKNKGKANEVTPQEQAHLEAYAARDIKLRQEWHSTMECTDWKPPFPMLAEKWDEADTNTLDLKGVVYHSQPKLDGVRCLAFYREGRVRLYSRKGQPFPDMPHITKALEPLFKDFPDTILDGELYNHEFQDDFNAIVSAVKNGDGKQAGILQYHVYDMASGNCRFSWRWSWLEGVLKRHCLCPPIVPVVTSFVTNPLSLNHLREKYLEQGYEGQMIRRDAPYEQGKRSKSLLKRKLFMDEEFELVALEEGIGNYTGCAKKATFKLPDGRTFGCQVKGNRKELMVLLHAWKHRKPDIVVQCTVKFFNYTPDGFPRFPTVKTVWWEGRDV